MYTTCRVGVLSSEISKHSKISPPPSLRSHLTSSPMGVLSGDYGTSTVQALESASILYLFLCSQLLTLLPPCAGVQLLKEFQAEYAKFEAQRQELTNAEKLFDLPLTMYPNLIEVDQQLRNLATIFQLYEEQRVGALIDAYNDTSMQSSHT